MSPHIFIFVWLGIVAFVAGTVVRKRPELISGKEELRYSRLFAVLVFIPIIYFAGTRGYTADTTSYIFKYFEMPDSFSGISSYMSKVGKDKGFYLLSNILHVIFGKDYTSYLMVLAVFQGISLMKLYRRYSSDFVLSVFLFVASVDYYSWMFNGLRQFMAVTIILLATPLFVGDYKGSKFLRYFLIVATIVIASTCHQSALLMLAFIWLARGEAWNKRTVLYILALLIIVFFVDRFTNVLDNMLESTQYTNVVSDYKQMEDDGTNPLRVLVYSIPAILAFISKGYIKENGDELINFCVNMSIISAGLYFISMFTSGIFIGRLPIYCSLYGYILLPWEINNMFSKVTSKLVTILMIVMYTAYYVFQMHFTWGII